MSSGLTRMEQLGALDIALKYVWDWSVAIDGGAHRGDWTDVMAGKFAKVIAFEPADDMVAQLRERFVGNEKVVVRHAAIWCETAGVRLLPDPDHPLKSYGRHVKPDGDVEGVAIDDMGLTSCGLIKLDLEGGEMMALRGAVKTIKRFRPVLIVECKRRIALRYDETEDAPGEFLAKFGAREVRRHGIDRIYAFKGTK